MDLGDRPAQRRLLRKARIDSRNQALQLAFELFHARNVVLVFLIRSAQCRHFPAPSSWGRACPSDLHPSK